MQKTDKKIDFKQEVKKAWQAFVRFVKPFANLESDVVLPKSESFLKKNIQMVYWIGCAIFAILGLSALFHFMIGQLLIIAVIFLMFRMLCELIAGQTKTKK